MTVYCYVTLTMFIGLQLGFEDFQIENLYGIIDENYDDYVENVAEEEERIKKNQKNLKSTL